MRKLLLNYIVDQFSMVWLLFHCLPDLERSNMHTTVSNKMKGNGEKKRKKALIISGG